MKTPIRNPFVIAARSRNSAGPMKDRRAPRGGSRNDMSDLMDEWVEDMDTCTSGSHDDPGVVE